MGRLSAVILVLVFALPHSALGQEWSDEQLEVWETVKMCWSASDIGTISSCIHDDLVTWGLGREVPLNKSDVVALNERWLRTQETEWSYFQPLNIEVWGDIAVVIYALHWAELSRVTGERTSGIVNWTEVFKKEGGRWLLVADHGTRVGGD